MIICSAVTSSPCGQTTYFKKQRNDKFTNSEKMKMMIIEIDCSPQSPKSRESLMRNWFFNKTNFSSMILCFTTLW